MYIYGLIDPNGPEIFYVGRTARPAARLRKHKKLSNMHAGKKLLARIRAVKNSGRQPEMVILERTEDKLREYAWIQFFDHLGLVNTVRRPVVPYTKKTPEELSEVYRKVWFKRNGGPPASRNTSKSYAKKTSEELSVIARESWKRKLQKFDRIGTQFIPKTTCE